MSKKLNRREFVKKSLLTSALVTGALSFEEKDLLAQMKKRSKPPADSDESWGQTRVAGQSQVTHTGVIEVDCSRHIGKLRHMLGVNNGPMGMSGRDFTKAYKEMGVDFIRTHDFYGPTDLHEIFPDWQADPADPKSYHFESSDSKIKAIVMSGFKVLFRLGESWERPPVKYNVPPPDLEKCAEVCRRIVMHYNEGWAYGFHFGIEYWEIWNEPNDGGFWTGKHRQFYNLYELVAKKLKKHDPTLKVGGPAIAEPDPAYLENFLKYLKEHNVPLDFYSWHSYSSDVKRFHQIDEVVRQALNAAGFGEAESICDEWNWTLRQERHHGPGNGAFTAAALIAFQDTTVSVQTRFRGHDHPWGGMFLQDGRMDKPAYAYKAMHMMLETPYRVEMAPSYGEHVTALAGLSADRRKLSLLLADYSNRKRTLSIEIRDLVRKSQKGMLTAWVLDAQHDLEKTESRTIFLKPTLAIEQELHCPAVHLLRFEVKCKPQ